MKLYLKLLITVLINLFIFVLVLSSCKKQEQYPIVPLIEFKDYIIESGNGIDTAIVLIFSFKDGDGDLGFPDEDSVSKSIHVYYYKKKDGVFILRVKPEDLANFDVKLPMFLNTGVKRPLKGDIEYSINVSLDAPALYEFDTIKVEFTLVDRASNVSNLISTPEIIIRKKKSNTL